MRRRRGQIGSIEIILAGNPNKREECISPSISQCRSHPMWDCCFRMDWLRLARLRYQLTE
jgi:hypothetical protein